MIQRITKTLLIGSLLLVGAAASPTTCNAWSLNPFSSGDKKETPKYTSSKAKKAPSVWDKATAGTKNFFNKTGEALGLKKPEKKKYTAAYANRKPIVKDKKDKSWFGWGQDEEEKPKNVRDWMSKTKQVTP